jgi:hypothetical protein
MSRRVLLASAFALAAGLAGSAAAGTLDFEEIPAANANRPGLSEEYATLGVHFHNTDDGALWDGTSRGDPGDWRVEGSNGSAFVGFNGASYAMVATFDAPVIDVEVDVAPAHGARPGTLFTLEGYREGLLVGRHELRLGVTGEWLTAAMEPEVDTLRLAGSGEGYHPFALDNLRWLSAEEPFEVDIQVSPGARAPLDLDAHGVVGVAIHGSLDLDVDGIDERSLSVGPDGARMLPSSLYFTDLDGDGWLDLVGLYPVAHTGVVGEYTDLCVVGETVEGWPFEGCLPIRAVASRDD